MFTLTITAVDANGQADPQHLLMLKGLFVYAIAVTELPLMSKNEELILRGVNCMCVHVSTIFLFSVEDVYINMNLHL